MILAITRPVPRSISEGERTHLERVAIHYETAAAQHSAYIDALRVAGCEILELEALDDLPDSVFVEDAAVVFDEFAVVTRPGAASRRGEIASVESALRRYTQVYTIENPGTIDGGDVLVNGKDVRVGLSSRTNPQGAAQLREIVARHGYRASEATFEGCLHLKSAATALPGGTILINPRWIDQSQFAGWPVLEADRDEPFAANALTIGNAVLFPPAYQKTMEMLRGEGYDVRPVDLSELAKAEGALTCCSILVRM